MALETTSSIYLHCFALGRDLRNAHVPTHLRPRDNLLVEDSRGALGEGVALQLGRPLVGTDVAALELGLVGGDDGDVDVAAGAEVVEDAGEDGVAAELDGVVAAEVGPPLGLENGHGGQRAGAHGDVGELVGGAVGVDGEKVDARGVDAGDDEVGADVALVAEEVLLEHRHTGDHAGLAARRERMELEVGGDDGRGELGVRGGSGARAPDLRRDVMQLLAVFVGDDGAGGCSCVGGNLDLTRASQRSPTKVALERQGWKTSE